ncbi:MAG: hypothetical protein P8J87_11160, partial [Verrucomicrobiales bacterium]|nr:hypothetical protein [Verrucomicrobiales bacterium]
GQLANNGESIRLENRNGRLMDDLAYGDDGDWPTGPDGSGATLVKRDQISANSRPANWTTSPNLGGSPGASNFPIAGQPPKTHSLIQLDSNWTYRDTNSPPPADWATTGFDDSSWSTGAGALYTGDPGNSGSGTNPGGIPDGLVGYWNFDGNVTDHSATGNNGTRIGATYSNDTPLSAGQSLNFDATTEHVLVNADASLNSNAFSITMFIKDRGQSSAINRLTSRSGDSSETGIDIHFGTGSLAYTSASSGWKTSTAVPALNTWQHIAYVATNSTMSIYVDGELAHGPAPYTGSPFGFMHIGNRHNNVEGFNGLIDEVGMWNRPLSATEVASLAGSSSLPTLQTELAHGSTAFYLRHQFQYNGSPSRTNLTLLPVIDDGAVVYLNGVEVHRENMPAGAVSHATPASSEIIEPDFPSAPVTLPATALINGTNILAVEIHQDNPASNDMLFATLLDAVEQPAPPLAEAPGLVFNEISASGTTPFAIELRNIGSSPVDLAGHTITLSGAGGTYPLPAQSLEPGQFLAIDSSTLGFTPVDGDRLFLLGPGGTRFIDARKVTNRLRGRHAGRWLYPGTATFGNANAFAFEENIVI